MPVKGSLKPDYTNSGNHYLVPADFNTIYDIKAAAGAGITGTGYHIAIIGGSRLTASDVANYESLTALPGYTPNVIVPTSLTDPGVSASDQTEDQLDFQRAYGTAPGAPIDLVIAQNWLSYSVSESLLMYAINTVNDPILSVSIGACEGARTSTQVQANNTLFSQAAAQGISVFISSGDAGAAGCNGITGSGFTTTPSINDLCASGYVTCVGGTQFSDLASPATYWSAANGTGLGSALTYIPEGAWNEPSYTSSSNTTVYQAAATGGGASIYISKPAFQTGSGVPADGFRDVPDVAFSSSANHDGYLFCQIAAGSNNTGPDCVTTFGVIGGTSAAAPSMAGIAALIDQKLNGRQGNMNTLLYKLAASSPAAFHDATPATSAVTPCALTTPSPCNNSVPEQSTALTPAVSGYALNAGFDQATGLGSLDVNAFLTAAATANTLAATTETLTAAPTTITTAQTAVFTATVSSTTAGTPSGTVQFSSNGANLGTAVTLAGGKAVTPTLPFTTAGTFTITAAYSGDTVYAASTTSITFTVTAPVLPATTTVLTANTASITTQGSVLLTATVTSTSAGTPTGTVQFSRVSGTTTVSLGTAVTVSAGKATFTASGLPAGTYTLIATYSGDSNFAGSVSTTTVPLTVTSIPTSTAISAISNTAPTATTAITFTATVLPATANSAAPTGTVQFFDATATTPFTTATLSGTTATTAAVTLAAGTHSITAMYVGDTVFGSSASSAATLTVAPVTITLTPASTSLTLTAGSPGTDVITATSISFAGTQTLSCAVTANFTGAANIPTCSFSPSTLAFTGSGSMTSTITVSSTAAHAVSGGSSASNRTLSLSALGGVSLASLLLLILPRRATRGARLLCSLFLLTAIFTALAGCGSSSGTGTGGGTTTTPGTSKGSYDVIINANSALNQTGNVGYSGTILLTIQ